MNGWESHGVSSEWYKVSRRVEILDEAPGTYLVEVYGSVRLSGFGWFMLIVSCVAIIMLIFVPLIIWGLFSESPGKSAKRALGVARWKYAEIL